MNVWCVGAGAIGGTVAARLARAGVEPTVVDADPEHVARLREPGLRVDGIDAGAVTPLSALTPDEASERDDGPDLLLLAVRTQATERALRPWVDRLGSHSDVVSLQNGINERRIAELAGGERTVGCVVGFGATYVGPGHVELTSPGELVIGRLDGSRDRRIEAVHDVLGRAFPARITPNVLGALWGKMLINSMTVLGAVCGKLLGEMLSATEDRELVAHVIAEGVDVAIAEGVELPDVLGGVSPGLVADRGPGWLEKMDEALRFTAEHFGDIKSVTLRDFELGREIEIDAVTGEIVRRGEADGVAVPLNAAVYRMLREIESGDRSIDPANFDELRAARR